MLTSTETQRQNTTAAEQLSSHRQKEVHKEGFISLHQEDTLLEQNVLQKKQTGAECLFNSEITMPRDYKNEHISIWGNDREAKYAKDF